MNASTIMESSRMYKYHRKWYGRYGIKRISVISSVQIEHYIVGVWLAIVTVLILLFVLMSERKQVHRTDTDCLSS